MRAFRLVPLLWTLALILSSSQRANGQTSTSTPPATSDPQAVALVQKALITLTSGASITDVTLTGSARRIAGSDDETGTATLTATSAGDSKVALSFPSGNRAEIRNHSAVPLPGALPLGVPANVASQPQPAGAWSGPDGALHPIVGHNLMTDATWFFPALTLANLASSPNYILSYVGPETLNGQAVVHVSAAQQFAAAQSPPGLPVNLPQHLSQLDLYLDPSSLLPVALVFNAHPDGNALVDIPVRLQFSNYRSTGGVLVPLHVQKFLNNGLVLDLQFANATLNSGLSTSAFALQ